MSDTATNTDTSASVVQGVVMPYSVDDRGNVADFYQIDESGEYSRVARLDREAGPSDDVDGIYTWDGDADVTAWAMANGYQWEIRLAKRLALLDMLEDEIKRVDWMLGNISGAEWRRLGVIYSGNPDRLHVDNAIANSRA